ncbi:hypothetical protein [Halococcus salsus]|uniref:hypothetical protein n=1 Tax=Halococcus salsus TaxID=2162894 RepID=UPI0013586318|nr:hypothetical protein [Halococcus salsus]
MADKLTLVELHLHADNNEFESELELNSDIGEVLRDRLGFGGSEDPLPFGDDETDSATADGGDTVQIGEDEESETETETETGSAVVEIDPDTEVEDEPDYDEADDSGGRGIGRTFLLLVVVGLLALAAWWYLGDDDIENEFEEL